MIVDVLTSLKKTSGANAKKEILRAHIENELLKRVLLYANDPLTPFHIIKVPEVEGGDRGHLLELGEAQRWARFFYTADRCASREITGNEAITAMHLVFKTSTPEEEEWMRKILKKHLAIGISYKTINSIFSGLIPVFDVALAQKFNPKRISHLQEFIVEPKLDGIRCFSIVENNTIKMYTRSGKLLKNFSNTIGVELLKLGEGCYDGELMGEDFTSLMRQAYRKENIDIGDTYLALFDFLPLDEWKSKETIMTTHERYEALLDKMCDINIDFEVLMPIERMHCCEIKDIDNIHVQFVQEGYEGVMIKDPTAPYKFGRSYGVMKLKNFHDADLAIKGFAEGTGRHVGKLGAVVVSYQGVNVQVGSGFSDELREQIWNDKSSFVGRIIEIRYQEITPDGSLRFPTFVCFRNDKK
jgi:DNA ligase-1